MILILRNYGDFLSYPLDRITVYVSFADFPRITLGPENPLRVEKDDTTQLNCIVDAKPAVTSVKWMKNGRFIDTHFIHTIPRVGLQDAGSYTCSADNGLGQVGKKDLELDVLYAPIVTLPQSREVNENDDVEIDCRVDSNPRPTSIHWYKEGDERFMQTGRTLRLNGVTAFHNGRYICSASNILQPTGKGSVTRTGNATIDINIRHAPGKTFIMPDKPVAIDGKPITLKCGATPSGYPSPNYKWWKDGSEDTPLAVGSEFTLEPARLNNIGTYHCQAANELGQAESAEMYLDVFKAPKIITPLQPSILKTEGDEGFHITCTGLGKPMPRVQWFKDGLEISAHSSLYEVSTTSQEPVNHQAVTVQSVLKFAGGSERIGQNRLMSTDRGHYTCQFENQVASSDSTLLLRVEHSPVVIHRYNKVAFDIGEPAFIRCRMQAYPEPKFDWSFRNSILQEDPRFYQMNSTNRGEDIHESMLMIKSVSQSSYGDYGCRAVNKMGPKRTTIKLEPKGKPERPESLKATSTTYNTITLTWQPGFNGGFENTRYIVQYRHGNELVPRIHDCQQRTNCNITRLDQNSPYLLKVKAVNERGESHFTEEIVAMTKVDAKQIPVPSNVHYEKSTRKASFGLSNSRSSAMELIAMVELENGDGQWSLFENLPMNSGEGEVYVANFVNNLRVRFCLELNEMLCGPYAEALVVDVRPNAATSASLKSPWVIGLIVVIVCFSLTALLLVLLKRCCCQKSKTLKTDDLNSNRPSIIHGTQPPPYNGIDNKGVDTTLKSDSDADNLKAVLYTNGYSVEPPHSNSNSANGGSVNSQDSLWNVKSNGATTDIYHLQASAPQQQQHPLPSNGYIYDPACSMANMASQHLMPGNRGFSGSEDYTHYPYPDEYLNERNRQYFADPNAAAYTVNQPKHSECKLLSNSQLKSKQKLER